jgi:hypothetical protein
MYLGAKIGVLGSNGSGEGVKGYCDTHVWELGRDTVTGSAKWRVAGRGNGADLRWTYKGK